MKDKTELDVPAIAALRELFTAESCLNWSEEDWVDSDGYPTPIDRRMEQFLEELTERIESIGWDEARNTLQALPALLDAVERLAATEFENWRLNQALSPSAETKAEYMGEFSFDGPEGMVQVPWTTIKEIMEKIKSYSAPAPASDAGREHGV